MTDYQRGWYISLLAACWKSSGFLPNDPDKLARIAGAEDKEKFKMELQEVLWAFDVCDDGVQSEACVPILDDAREVAGIVDVEAKPKGFFGADRLSVIAALALVTPAVLP